MASEIDVELGRRLRQLRSERSVSQTALGEHLGISFQQVQKYESGSNRISVATLIRICRFFAVDPAAFLTGLIGDGAEPSWKPPSAPDPFSDSLRRIGDGKVRKLIERLIVALSEDSDPAPLRNVPLAGGEHSKQR